MTGLIGITDGPHCRLYQWGYAVASMKNATALFAKKLGVEFHVTENRHAQDKAGRPYVFHTGHAFVNDLAIELIQPAGGADHLYRDCLGCADDEIRLHHMGYRVPTRTNWDAICVEIMERGLPIAREGSYPDVLEFAFVDTRDVLGLYLEFVFVLPGGQRRYEQMTGRHRD